MYVCMYLSPAIYPAIYSPIYLFICHNTYIYIYRYIYIYIYIMCIYIYIKGIYIYMYTPLSFCVLFIQLDTDRYRQIQILTWIQTKKNKVAVEKKQPSPLQVGQTSMARCPKPRFSLKLCPCPKLKLWRLHGKVPTARSPRQGHGFQAELEPKAKKTEALKTRWQGH